LGVDAASGAMNKYSDNNQIALVSDPVCTSYPTSMTHNAARS
jgi:hypothetical protein